MGGGSVEKTKPKKLGRVDLGGGSSAPYTRETERVAEFCSASCSERGEKDNYGQL